MESIEQSPIAPKPECCFDRRMYGALLRHMRTEAGYRKGEDFVTDLAEIGLNIPVATLYRYERGDQEPTFEFVSAVNLLLFGNLHTGKITNSCLPEAWSQPKSSDTVMRVLKRNGALNRLPSTNNMVAAERADYYDEIMSTVNSYDFDIFPNMNCTENDLFMTVRFGEYDDNFPEDADAMSYRIELPEDVERSILNFLKSHEFKISGEEIDKLVRYGIRRMQPHLEAYELI